MSNTTVETWVVWRRADGFLARYHRPGAWPYTDDGRVVARARSLGELRRRLPPGLVRSDRDQGDPADLVERWL